MCQLLLTSTFTSWSVWNKAKWHQWELVGGNAIPVWRFSLGYFLITHTSLIPKLRRLYPYLLLLLYLLAFLKGFQPTWYHTNNLSNSKPINHHLPVQEIKIFTTYLFRTLRYSLVYMPLPGPPAENDPPPPIIMLRTQKAMKSGSLWEQLSSPTTMCASSGIGVGPRLTLDKSFST